MTTRPVSATISALADAIGAGSAGAAEAFWTDVASTATPLVEAAPEHEGHRLITFLWRELPQQVLERVVVVGGPARWDPIADDQMEHIAGSDVWFRTYLVRDDLFGRYWLSPNDSLESEDEIEDWEARESTFVADPLNPLRVHWPVHPADPTSHEHDCSLLPPLTAPDTAGARAGFADISGVSDRTTVRPTRWHSTILGNERTVWTRGTADGRPATAVVILLDGWIWAEVLPIEIPDHCAVLMIDSLDNDTRVRELSCHEPFVRFLTDEALPAVRAIHPVADDADVVIAGQSLGGLTAAYAAYLRPEIFTAVVSQSGSFWWERGTPFDEGSEWLTREFADAPLQPTRFSLAIGLLEGVGMVPANRHLRNVLVAHGAHVTYREYMGGHDWTCWHRLLPTMLADVIPPPIPLSPESTHP